MKLREKQAVVLLIVFVCVNIVVIVMFRRSRSRSNELSTAAASYRAIAERIDNNYLESRFDIKKSNNSEPLLLRASFDQKNVGLARTKVSYIHQNVQDPNGKTGQIWYELVENRVMKSCAPDGSLATFELTSEVATGTYNLGPNIFQWNESITFTLDHLGYRSHKQVTRKVSVYNNPIDVDWYGCESISFSEAPVRPNDDTWVVYPELPEDVPDAIKQDPPTLTCKLLDRVSFEGVEAALIRGDGHYFSVEGKPASRIDKWDTTWRTYVALDDGRELWHEFIVKNTKNEKLAFKFYELLSDWHPSDSGPPSDMRK